MALEPKKFNTPVVETPEFNKDGVASLSSASQRKLTESKNVVSDIVGSVLGKGGIGTFDLGTNPINKVFPNNDSPAGKIISDIVRSTGLSQFVAGRESDDIERRNDPQLNIHWAIQLPEIEGAQMPYFYVEDVMVGQMEVGVESYKRANGMRHEPGSFSFPGTTLTLYEDIRGLANDFFLKWRSLAVNSAGYGKPSVFKKTMIVTLHDPKEVISVRAEIKRCWPHRITPTQLTSANSDRLRLDVSFENDAVDWYIDGNFSSMGVGVGLLNALSNKIPSSIGQAFLGAANAAASIGNIIRV